MSEGSPRQPPEPPRRVSHRLRSKDRLTWAPGGIPRQVTPAPPLARGQAEPSQPDRRPGQRPVPAQRLCQPAQALLKSKAGQVRMRQGTRPVRPTGVQQMADSGSECEEGTPASAAVMAGHKRAAPQVTRPGSKEQAAQRYAWFQASLNAS